MHRRGTDGPHGGGLGDEDSVTWLRPEFAPGLRTALGRIEGGAVGLLANNTLHTAGAILVDTPE